MLLANRWSDQLIEAAVDPVVLTGGTGSLFVRTGWHDDPATGESWVIEQERRLTDHVGRTVRLDTERWVYEIAGSPPLEFHRTTFGNVYLPGLGRYGSYNGLHKLEEEHTVYYPWTSAQPGANLSRQRTLAAIVVYDMRPHEEALPANVAARLRERGYQAAAGLPHVRILDSARLWSEAILGGELVEQSDVMQRGYWIDPVITEIETVYNEIDKFTSWTVTRNHVRPDSSSMSGPIHQRKEHYVYRLPVPLEPPVLEGTAVAGEGVRLEVRGGGAIVKPTFGAPTPILPERYLIERRVASGGDRAPSGDPFGVYDVEPASPPGRSTLWQDTAVTDFALTPSSALPAQTSYTEPGDVTEPEPLVEEWAVVADLKNVAPWPQAGQARCTDEDVVDGAEYQYRALAVVGEEQSPPCNPITIPYAGATKKAGSMTRVRRAEDGSVEVDVLAPEDTGLLPLEYGETIIFENVPIDLLQLVDMTAEDGDYYQGLEEVVEELATAAIARDRR